MLELINRARANPAAEGMRLAAQAGEEVSIFSDCDSFGTNLVLMKQEMAAIPAAPPLTFNAILIGTARAHSAYMLANNVQTHNQTGALTNYWDRMDLAGYDWSEAAENIFASAVSPGEAHAAYEIDWGIGVGGMRDGRGHRVRLHSWTYRDIGIGWAAGSGSNVGPYAVTHNLGELRRLSQIKPYLTGVAIYDVDGDGFYDIGEGIAGVKVTVDRVTGSGLVRHDKFAITAGSGGYSVPVDAAGNYLVHFEVPGLPLRSVAVTVVSETAPGTSAAVLTNRKVDLVLREGEVPGYTAPAISGTTQVAEGSTSLVDFAATAGAIEYEVVVSGFDADPLGQDAVVSAPVTADKDASYALVAVPLNQGDRLAFHLAHASVGSAHQSMTLERVFVPGAVASITFDSRLRRAGSGQIACLQVTGDAGASWTDLWFEQGTGSLVDAMTPVTVDVSPFAGQPIKFRFQYFIGGGTIISGTGSSYGWHFDDLRFTGMTELIGASAAVVTASEYPFTPPGAGDYFLQVRARAGDVFLPFADWSIFEVVANSYAGWVTRQEAAGGLSAGSLGDSGTDYDGDGLTQFAEYALEPLGLDPSKADSTMVPRAVIEGDALCLHYKVDLSRGDAGIAVEVSTNLHDWYLPGEPGAPAGFVDYQAGAPVGTVESRTAAVPFAGHELLFLRLKITELGAP